MTSEIKKKLDIYYLQIPMWSVSGSFSDLTSDTSVSALWSRWPLCFSLEILVILQPQALALLVHLHGVIFFLAFNDYPLFKPLCWLLHHAISIFSVLFVSFMLCSLHEPKLFLFICPLIIISLTLICKCHLYWALAWIICLQGLEECLAMLCCNGYLEKKTIYFNFTYVLVHLC